MPDVSESVEALAAQVRDGYASSIEFFLQGDPHTAAENVERGKAALDTLLARHQEALDLLAEAYLGDYPTNRWRARVEKLGAWPP